MQLDNDSPVAKYVGISAAAGVLLGGGTYFIQTAARPARSLETTAPITGTKPAELETKRPLPQMNATAPDKPTRRDVPHSSPTDGVHVKGYYRNGKWIKGYDRGRPDDNLDHNKRPPKRAD